MKKLINAYKIVRNVKNTVLSPIHTVRNAVRDFLLKQGTAQVVRWFEMKYPDTKPPEWKKNIRMNLPPSICSMLPATDFIALVVMIADDALAIPLAAIGYKVGSLSCTIEGHTVIIHIHAKLIKD